MVGLIAVIVPAAQALFMLSDRFVGRMGEWGIPGRAPGLAAEGMLQGYSGVSHSRCEAATICALQLPLRNVASECAFSDWTGWPLRGHPKLDIGDGRLCESME
jgi:hypothetical protein